MIRGKVTGQVWSTKRIENLPVGALLEVDVGDKTIVAYDALGCGVGEEVLITQGTVAAAYFDGDKPLVDALIIGSIDNA